MQTVQRFIESIITEKKVRVEIILIFLYFVFKKINVFLKYNQCLEKLTRSLMQKNNKKTVIYSI